MSGAAKIESVLFLAPESPYPLHGGGQYRTASLIHYFARFANVDLILFSEGGKPALLPPGLIRNQTVIPLRKHGKGALERYARNARRALRGVPPLIDRLGGLESEIAKATDGKHYDLGIVEHFWLAPYIDIVNSQCDQTFLDLHNLESVLHRTCGRAANGLIAAGHRRFSAVSRNMEARLLPRFSGVLATSEADRARALDIAPNAKIHVYPNAIPYIIRPERQNRLAETEEPPSVVFSGNFEYHPNVDAIDFLIKEIWPLVLRQRPELRLRLVGRGEKTIRPRIPVSSGVEITGEVPDAMTEIAQARLVIAPLRMGSGTRIKILEAWAAARPVVATPIAAEGLAATDQKDILLANSPQAFADSVLTLLADSSARNSLAREGRLTFERHYTWGMAWKALDHTLQVTRIGKVDRYTG